MVMVVITIKIMQAIQLFLKVVVKHVNILFANLLANKLDWEYIFPIKQKLVKVIVEEELKQEAKPIHVCFNVDANQKL